MNQVQRKFLIDKIEKQSKVIVDALRASLPKPPNPQTYLFHAVMSGNFEIITQEEMRALLLDRALNADGKEFSWLVETNTWGDLNHKRHVSFPLWKIFKQPPDYKALWDKYEAKTKELNDQITAQVQQTDSLVTRIQLASDKTLEKVISEIDNMRDISLFDTKLRAVSASDPLQKLN